ncbi:Hypothetical protein CINCED_3A014057 [Cinara cedri]|uniref:Mff-like domain-containing protein n=1 Tax=Cinara cedri TaxID=506608 RepID=A0A5E4NHQ9_9HEMI|nr:Hypothetical protein CINCED_3A014057 [Cinara cedri]
MLEPKVEKKTFAEFLNREKFSIQKYMLELAVIPNAVGTLEWLAMFGDDSTRFGDNFDMRVPEKIIIMGNKHHRGTKSNPKEFINDLVIPHLAMEEHNRVQTPQQKITMSRHYFLSVLDNFKNSAQTTEETNFYPKRTNFLDIFPIFSMEACNEDGCHGPRVY